MKKSAFIITGLLIATQSFATGISGNSATCDSGALGSEDGSVAMRANYEPESIGLRWYDENNNLLTVNSASNSCTYGGTITIPNPPTKTGYKFTGWKIINIFSTLDTSIKPTYRYAKCEENGEDSCWYSGMHYACDYDMTDLARGEFKAPFSYGIVYGKSMCSSASNGSTPTNNTGSNCWCILTGLKPTNSDVIYESSNLPWVMVNTFNGDTNSCISHCANECSIYLDYMDSRKAFYGQS